MSAVSISILAFSMSIDAFIACMGKGANLGKPSFSIAIRTGAVFGAIEAVTPLVGWAIGVAASQYVAAIDHWIAFALLAAVGLHMIRHSLAASDGHGVPGTMTFWVIIVTAIGTSLDAMAVGMSLALLDADIIVIAMMIGLTTMLMSSIGLMIGRYLGQRFGKAAEALGGFALIGLGTLILCEHLTAA